MVRREWPTLLRAVRSTGRRPAGALIVSSGLDPFSILFFEGLDGDADPKQGAKCPSSLVGDPCVTQN